jgi:hypothetical protein
MHPITARVHHEVARVARSYEPIDIIDMGGTGKLRTFLDAKIVDANIRKGIDCTKLPYGNESFDVAVSIATLEHVDNQPLFLAESLRVSRKGSIHWFPFGEQAAQTENFKAHISKRSKSSYSHPCVVPGTDLVQEVSKWDCKALWDVFVSVDEHMLLLSTLYDHFNTGDVFDFVSAHSGKPYGVVLTLEKNK